MGVGSYKIDGLVMTLVDYIYMGVSKNRGGPPKWMVYKGKPYEQMDDLGVFPYFWRATHMKLGY